MAPTAQLELSAPAAPSYKQVHAGPRRPTPAFKRLAGCFKGSVGISPDEKAVAAGEETLKDRKEVDEEPQGDATKAQSGHLTRTGSKLLAWGSGLLALMWDGWLSCSAESSLPQASLWVVGSAGVDYGPFTEARCRK